MQKTLSRQSQSQQAKERDATVKKANAKKNTANVSIQELHVDKAVNAKIVQMVTVTVIMAIHMAISIIMDNTKS